MQRLNTQATDELNNTNNTNNNSEIIANNNNISNDNTNPTFLKPLDFQSIEQIQAVCERLKNILAAEATKETGIKELNKHLIVATNGLTYILDDVLNANIGADRNIEFLCRPTNGEAKALTVDEIREKALLDHSIRFIFHYKLAEALKPIIENKDIKSLENVVCDIRQDALISPFITFDGHSYSDILITHLLKSNNDPITNSGLEMLAKDGVKAPLGLTDIMLDRSLAQLLKTYYRDKLVNLLKVDDSTQPSDVDITNEIEKIKNIYQDNSTNIKATLSGLQKYLQYMQNDPHLKIYTKDEYDRLIQLEKKLVRYLSIGDKVLALVPRVNIRMLPVVALAGMAFGQLLVSDYGVLNHIGIVTTLSAGMAVSMFTLFHSITLLRYLRVQSKLDNAISGQHFQVFENLLNDFDKLMTEEIKSSENTVAQIEEVTKAEVEIVIDAATKPEMEIVIDPSTTKKNSKSVPTTTPLIAHSNFKKRKNSEYTSETDSDADDVVELKFPKK